MKKRFWVSCSLFLLFFSCQSLEPEQLTTDYYNLAMDFHKLGRLERAEFYYQLCLDQDFPPLEAVYNLSILYMETGNLKEADNLIGQMERKDSDNRELKQLRLLWLIRSEEYDQAKSLGEALLEIYPRDSYTLESLAELYIWEEDYEKSWAYLERISEQDQGERFVGLALTVLPILEMELEEREILHRFREQEWMTRTWQDRLVLLNKNLELYPQNLLLLDFLAESYPQDRGVFLFEKASIYLENLGIWEEGLRTLRQAFAAGFQDKNAANELKKSLDRVLADEVDSLIHLYILG